MTTTTSTTTIPISDTTGEITTITTAITTTTITTTTSSVTLSTTTSAPYDVISTYDEPLPYETNHIIIMATVIPGVWIAFIIAFIWARGSRDIVGSITHPFNNLSRGGKTWGSYELETVSKA